MAPTITLYTAHECPFAHRLQIVLRELGLPFQTYLVDIYSPRTPEYLAINPSGMVPALAYDGRILTESGLISQFLVDAHPSHLLPASGEPAGALQRYKIGYLADVYFGKSHVLWDSILYAVGVDAKTNAANRYIESVVHHVEPLLADANPFFGGASRLTFAEV
jgi:glutathione S-transferase